MKTCARSISESTSASERDAAQPHEANPPAQALAAPHADAAAAAVDPPAAAVDRRAQRRGRADAAGESAARKGRGRRRIACRPRRRPAGEASRPESEARAERDGRRATRLPSAPRRPRRARTRKASTARTSRTIRPAIPTGAARSSADDDDGFFPQQVAASSLRDHLLRQLAELNLPLRDRQIVASLIDALDDDGYLHTSLEEIAELFPEELDIDPDELSIALRYVQSFEPAGIGARDASECLTLQLKALPRDDAAARRGAASSSPSTCRCSPRATSRS